MVVVGPHCYTEPVGDLGVDRVDQRYVLVRVAQDAPDGFLVVFLYGDHEDRGTQQVSQEGLRLRGTELTQYKGVRFLQRGVGDDCSKALGFEPCLLLKRPLMQRVGGIGGCV